MENEKTAPKKTTKSGKTIKITQIHSVICCTPKQRATMKALGFHTMNQTKIMPDNDAIRGMIKVVKHLVKVEE
ncbi:MAG: 50S ribosomal protein L30 [Clostridia bacterium]|nr:50S ribosomal protein L30 [Clostridia bacterium]